MPSAGTGSSVFSKAWSSAARSVSLITGQRMLLGPRKNIDLFHARRLPHYAECRGQRSFVIFHGAARRQWGAVAYVPGRVAVSQTTGLGRGLAALLPGDGLQPHIRNVDAPTSGVGVNALSEDLAASVATTESGIALIYKALDALVDQFELADAAVVIEEPGLGRQVFRA